MVQAGVNPFPAGPGFTAAPNLNVQDGNLPVSVGVKNDALATALKPETNVNLTPAISVTQVSDIGVRLKRRELASRRLIYFLFFFFCRPFSQPETNSVQL